MAVIEGVKWRPYQQKCFNSIYDSFKNKKISKQLVVQATGLGKRLQAVNVSTKFSGRSLFLAHSEELIEQAYNDMVKFHNFTDVGIIKGSKFEVEKKVVIASPQTITNRLDRIDKKHFQLIQIDECFTRETKVSGKCINEIVVGDIVDSFNHITGLIEKKKVLSTSKKERPDILVKFERFTCTKNHPIFVKNVGYSTAYEIYISYICHIPMCYIYDNVYYCLQGLWKNIFPQKWKNFLLKRMRKKVEKIFERNQEVRMFGMQENVRMGGLEERQIGYPENQKNIHGFTIKRVWLLLREMQKNLQKTHFERFNDFVEQVERFRKDEEKQSYVQSCNKRKNEKVVTGKNVSFSWWKRKVDRAAKKGSRTNKSSDGIRNSYKRTNIFRNLFTTLLQSRSSLSGSKVSNRNRRKYSSVKTLEVLRQTENERFEFVGLDCPSLQKRRSKRARRKGNPNNYVYNLEIEGNNNYFANGILVHNCHRYMARTWVNAVNHFTPTLTIGWTATPYRLDGLSLKNLFDEIVFEYNINNGIEDKFLCELDGIRVKTETDLSSVHRRMGDFSVNELSNKVDTPARNRLIVESYKKYAEDRQAIGFCVDVQHCINLKEEFLKNNIPCEIIVADEDVCPDRKGVNERFRNGTTKVLLNVQILIEGWDYSDVGAVLMIRPTESLTFYMQAIGRGTRNKSEQYIQKYSKNECKIIDFVDNSGKHSLVNTWTLDKNMKAKDKIFVNTEKREKLIEKEQERARREAVINSRTTKDSRINLFKLPEVKNYDGEWTKDEATEKQLDYLKKLGLYEEGMIYTKGMCSELINSSKAEGWQLRQLSKWGYDISVGNVTNGQYQKVRQTLINDHKFDTSFNIKTYKVTG